MAKLNGDLEKFFFSLHRCDIDDQNMGPSIPSFCFGKTKTEDSRRLELC